MIHIPSIRQPKKRMTDFVIKGLNYATSAVMIIDLTPAEGSIADFDIQPGQFVEIVSPHGESLLRRPISICAVSAEYNMLTLLIRPVGAVTKAINRMWIDDTLNLIWPLGHGFTTTGVHKPLLVAGGVGAAPLNFLANRFATMGVNCDVILAARTAEDLLLRYNFENDTKTTLHIATDDGSEGFHGYAAEHPALQSGDYDMIYACGPLPMMKAVAATARRRNIPCEVSLENLMGCGLGACLCCVEPTVDGNVCVCTEGPVFNTSRLLW